MANIPKTLFLQGAFLENTMTLGNIFTSAAEVNLAQYSPSYSNSVITKPMYDKIPSIYISFKLWPKQTNLSCCQCTLPINGPPIPIPNNVEPSKQDQKIFDVEKKVCCGFSCAARIITITISNSRERRNMMMMLKIIRKDFYMNGYPHKILSDDKNISDLNILNKLKISNDIPLAPTGNRLTRFGGDMENDEFIKTIKNLEKM